MTSIAQQLDVSRLAAGGHHRMAEPDWSRVVEVSEAANQLGKNAGALRRRCAREWQQRGLAFHAADPRTGKLKWWVDRSIDPKLAAGGVSDLQREPDMSIFSERQRQGAYQRREAVLRFRHAKATRNAPVKQWLAALLEDLAADRRCPNKVSRAQLYRWDQLYRTPSDLHKLVDQRGGDQKSTGDPAAWDHFRALYLDERQPSIRSCWKQTRAWAQANQVSWCSYSTAVKQLDQRIPPEQQLAAREPRKYRDQLQPRIDQDPEAWGAGSRWDGDHTQLDYWVRSQSGNLFRPWITAWKDWRSRKVVGWVVSDGPNSSTILAALKMGLEDPDNHGGPDECFIDNGNDYDSFIFHGQTKTQRQSKRRVEVDESTFQGIYRQLGIDVHFSLPFNPTGKSRVERWFGTVHDQHDRSQATYCGRSPEKRPEGLTKILKDPSNAPTFEQARHDIDRYIRAWNASIDHQVDDLVDAGGHRLSPDQAMATWCDRRRVLPEPHVLNLLMQHWHKPVGVGKRGVTIAPYGVRVSYGAFEPALMAYKSVPGRKQRALVYVTWDPADTSRVQVWDDQMRWICEARENERGGGRALDRRQAGELYKRKREYQKAVKTTANNRELEIYTPAQLLEMQNAEQQEKAQQAGSAEEKTLRFEGRSHAQFEDASKGIQRARIREAAGGEGFRGTTLDESSDQGGVAGSIGYASASQSSQSSHTWGDLLDDSEPIPMGRAQGNLPGDKAPSIDASGGTWEDECDAPPIENLSASRDAVDRDVDDAPPIDPPGPDAGADSSLLEDL